MKVSRDSLTLGDIAKLEAKGYVIEVDADEEFADVHKAEPEKQVVEA